MSWTTSVAKRGVFWLIVIACCLLAFSCGSLGRLRLPPPDPDKGYGITGYVGESSMVAATDENVTLIDAQSKEVVATAKTDFLGRFKLYPLRPGEYILLVGTKNRTVSIRDDHVQIDVNLASETGEMNYGEVASAGSAPAAAVEPSPSTGGAAPEPGGSPPSGSGGPRGCYVAKYTMMTTQYWFDGQGRFKQINWNVESGTFTYSGSYQLQGNKIVLAFDGGETKAYEVLRLDAQGIQWGDGSGSWTYVYQGDQCA